MSETVFILTAAGARRMEAELRELQTTRRQEVAEHIRHAKDLGDLAENPEYEDAKTEQAFVEGRIADLKSILSAAHIVETEDVSTEEIGVGAVSVVREIETGEDWEFTMVGSFEADPDADRISNESPIGGALVGHKVGDRVEIRVPLGSVSYEVISIRREDE